MDDFVAQVAEITLLQLSNTYVFKIHKYVYNYLVGHPSVEYSPKYVTPFQYITPNYITLPFNYII